MPSPVSGRPAQRACVGWNRGARNESYCLIMSYTVKGPRLTRQRSAVDTLSRLPFHNSEDSHLSASRIQPAAFVRRVESDHPGKVRIRQLW